MFLPASVNTNLINLSPWNISVESFW